MAILAFAVVPATSPKPAHADTYQYTFDLNPLIAPSTPIVFDTTGPIALGSVYSVISGSIASVAASTFEVDPSDNLIIGVGRLSAPLLSFTAITSGSEVLDDDIDSYIGTLYAIDTTPVIITPVPEIDPTTALSAFTLLAGAVMILRGRRKRLPEPITQPDSCWIG